VARVKGEWIRRIYDPESQMGADRMERIRYVDIKEADGSCGKQFPLLLIIISYVAEPRFYSSILPVLYTYFMLKFTRDIHPVTGGEEPGMEIDYAAAAFPLAV
jgi:hypothetical protein